MSCRRPISLWLAILACVQLVLAPAVRPACGGESRLGDRCCSVTIAQDVDATPSCCGGDDVDTPRPDDEDDGDE